MSAMRAKFKVTSVAHHEGWNSVKMSAVYGGSEENDRFFTATPSGTIEVGTINDSAVKEFTPGREFYIDFTPADDQ